jgi:hypothetical protein
VALGPLEVHPQEHLGPVGGLGAARAGADRKDGVLRVVLAAEQEERPLALELRGQGGGLPLEVRLRLGVGRLGEEVEELGEVVGALLERAPERDLLAEALGLAGDLLRLALVVPEPGLDRSRVQLGDAAFLGG